MKRRQFLTGAALSLLAASGKAATSGLFQPFIAPSRSPRFVKATDFGAVGDGATDNTLAFTKAVEALRVSGGGTLMLPAGRYIYEALDVELPYLELYGVGATLVSSLPRDTAKAAVWLRCGHAYVHDLTFDFVEPLDVRDAATVRARKPNAYGLRVGGRRDPTPLFATEVLVERVNVYNARGGGIEVYKASNATVRKSAVRQALGNGIGFDGCPANIIAEDNLVEFTGDDMLVVVTDYTVPGGTRGAIFMRNQVRHGFAKGIASSGVDGLTIEKNAVEDTYAGGIAIIKDSFYGLGQSSNVTIVDNIVRRAGRNYGPGLFRDSKSTVGESIYVSAGTSQVSVLRNDLVDGDQDGIVITRCDHVAVEANTIRRHPGRAIVLGDPASGTERINTFRVVGNNVSGVPTGLVVGAATNGTVERNIIDVSHPGATAGIVTGKLHDVAVERNTISVRPGVPPIRSLDGSLNLKQALVQNAFTAVAGR